MKTGPKHASFWNEVQSKNVEVFFNNWTKKHKNKQKKNIYNFFWKGILQVQISWITICCGCSARPQKMPVAYNSFVDVPQVPDELADFVTRLCLHSLGSLKPWQLLTHLREPAGFPMQVPVPCFAPDITVNTLYVDIFISSLEPTAGTGWYENIIIRVSTPCWLEFYDSLPCPHVII